MSLFHPDGHMLYMGKDKYENEDLIRYGLPEDVWFHVDNLSSAHVYLRMNRSEKVGSGEEFVPIQCGWSQHRECIQQ